MNNSVISATLLTFALGQILGQVSLMCGSNQRKIAYSTPPESRTELAVLLFIQLNVLSSEHLKNSHVCPCGSQKVWDFQESKIPVCVLHRQSTGAANLIHSGTAGSTAHTTHNILATRFFRELSLPNSASPL